MPSSGNSGFITTLGLTIDIKSIPSTNFPYIPDDTPPDVLEKILESVAASSEFKEINLLLKKGANTWIEKAKLRLFNKEPYYEIDLMPYFSKANTIDVAEDLSIGIQIQPGTLLGALDKITVFGTVVEEKSSSNTGDEDMSRIVGEIIAFGGVQVPTGWLLCNGAERPIDGYQKLYEILGVQWGSLTNGLGQGGATHFKLPDLRGRSLIGAGAGAGLTNRAIGQAIGSEAHVLTVAEMPSHNHTQDAHNHTQSAHNHAQDAHNHAQDAHNHAQSAHNHAQDAHNHVQNPHSHNYNWFAAPNAVNGLSVAVGNLSSQANIATSVAATATNNVATATNQATTATNNAITAINQTATATNQVATATNNTATATNQITGGGAAHNNMQPSAVVNYLIFAG